MPHPRAKKQQKKKKKKKTTAKRRPSRAERVEALCRKAERAREREDHEASRAFLEAALALDPRCSDAIWWLGDYWHVMEKPKPALKYYRRYLRRHPGDPEAIHMIASLGGRKSPKRASDGYLKLHFDSYAEDFDKSLLKELEYQAPKVLARMIAQARGPGAVKADICDLGCGTGLVGRELKRMARTLTGVDLSRNMLAQARARGIYDRLAASEATRFLRRHRAAYDLITAADVLIYIGDVAPLFKAAARALRPGGILAVSAERTRGRPYRLTISGRYAHDPDWLTKVAAKAGLVLSRKARKRLRMELGKPVPGFYGLYRRPA